MMGGAFEQRYDISKDTFTLDDIPIDDNSSISSFTSDIVTTMARSRGGPGAVAPKSILKKRPASCTAVPSTSFHQRGAGLPPSGYRGGSGGPTRSGASTSSGSSLRDSLEVTKNHLVTRQTSELTGSEVSE
jgi:hypothetical protein